MSSNNFRRTFNSSLIMLRAQEWRHNKWGEQGMSMITAHVSTVGIACAQDPRRGPPDTTTVEVHILHHPQSHHSSKPVQGETFTKRVETLETSMKRLETLETFQEPLITSYFGGKPYEC